MALTKTKQLEKEMLASIDAITSGLDQAINSLGSVRGLSAERCIAQMRDSRNSYKTLRNTLSKTL